MRGGSVWNVTCLCFLNPLASTFHPVTFHFSQPGLVFIYCKMRWCQKNDTVCLQIGRGIVFLRSLSQWNNSKEPRWWRRWRGKWWSIKTRCWCVFPLTIGTRWLKTCTLINTTGCFTLPSLSTQIWVCRSNSYRTVSQSANDVSAAVVPASRGKLSISVFKINKQINWSWEGTRTSTWSWLCFRPAPSFDLQHSDQNKLFQNAKSLFFFDLKWSWYDAHLGNVDMCETYSWLVTRC